MQTLNSTVILDHCLAWMERIGWLRNFDRIAGTSDAPRAGIEFVDSEIYKLLEAMAWELGRTHDVELEREYREVVERLGAAQDEDGYLHTAFGHEGQPARYTDLEWGHELYCHGHLLQAAVARLRTGHDDELPQIARRLADHLWLTFGPDGREVICGHPEIELALAEFGRATADPRCLELARLLVERRGHRTLRTTLYQGHEYFLDDVPVRDAEVLRGHAVRALYFASGALDVAVETGDVELAAAVEKQYLATVARRTYLTGGMGAHHQNEEFGSDFELPADRAYAETCAAIGSVMTAWRLLLATGEAEFADQIERTLLNAVLVSPRRDGRAFYYANTLHQRVLGNDVADGFLSERAEAVVRAPWFAVSCCPTNVARTLASIAAYVATRTETGIQLHQFVACRIDTSLDDGSHVALTIETAYPETGEIRVTIEDAPAHGVHVGLRIPMWAREAATVTVNDESLPIDGTYAGAGREFLAGDVINLRLPLEPRFTTADPRIDGVRGQVAVERGPLVLALEDHDLPDGVDVDHVVIDMSSPIVDTAGYTTAMFRLREYPSRNWPYGHGGQVPRARVTARLIPYKDWANRGPSTMRVWMPTA
jgi:DUF1680 family protein